MASVMNRKTQRKIVPCHSLPRGTSGCPPNTPGARSLFSARPPPSSLTWALAFPRSGTACGQQSASWRKGGSGQTNHKQISSRLARPGSTSRFFQNSITAWVMTGSAGTQSYLDHCGATVIEFEGCREQWWNRIRRAIVAARAPRGPERGSCHGFTHCACTHTQRDARTQTHLFSQQRPL